MKFNLAARRSHARYAAADGMGEATGAPVRLDSGLVSPSSGADLLCDHWYTDDADGATVLVRTPYGRASLAGFARFVAERGHHVVVQSCRGTDGSGGRFEPLLDEVVDGQATMVWLRSQPWATGSVHGYGFSYAGITQWAMADGDDRPDAMVIGLSARRIDEALVHHGGGFSAESILAWALALSLQQQSVPQRLWHLLGARRTLARAVNIVPPGRGADFATGGHVDFYDQWLEHGLGDPWWQRFHFGERLDQVGPVTLVGGWQDVFLPGTLADFEALQRAGAQARLVVGDWDHHGTAAGIVAVRALLQGLASEQPQTQDHRLPGASSAPAQIQVRGAGTDEDSWRSLPSWPPQAIEQIWQLQGDRTLCPQARGSIERLDYRYDPSDPTPSCGGRTLNPFTTGRHDQQPRERRPDVVVFTSDPLTEPLELLGAPWVALGFCSTNPLADLFVRLCQVDASGSSRPVTDGYLRHHEPADQQQRRVHLDAVAHRFEAGTRLRLQISSGAHGLYLRNPGTEEPLTDFSQLLPSNQVLLVGAGRSSLHLLLNPEEPR